MSEMIEAVYTIPELLLRAEQREAELADYKMRLAEDVRELKTSARFGEKSYVEVMKALKEQAVALRREAQDRARMPNQMVLGFE